MYEQTHLVLPTATHVAVELPDYQPIRLSFHSACSGLQIQGFQLGSNVHLHVPSICEDMLILQTTGVTKVEGQVGQRIKQDKSTPGTMYLVPHVAFPYDTPQPGGGLAQPALRLVLDYIDTHLTNDLTLAEIAGLTNYSPYHFMRLFKQSTGRTLHVYVIERRVEAARHLLSSGQLSVAEVTTMVGFHGQGHLGRHFKRLLGITPTKLIKNRKIIREDRKIVRAPDPEMS